MITYYVYVVLTYQRAVKNTYIGLGRAIWYQMMNFPSLPPPISPTLAVHQADFNARCEHLPSAPVQGSLVSPILGTP
jgi:hypothetical protein